MSSQKYLRVKDVAARLGVQVKSVLTLIRNGELRAFDVSLNPGGRPRWRILPEDLDAFIARRTYEKAGPRKRRTKRKPTKRYF